MNEDIKAGFSRKLAELFRHVAYLEAERDALMSMFLLAEAEDLSAAEWRTLLASLREKERYQTLLRKYDQTVQELERAADFQEMQRLLSLLPAVSSRVH